MKALTDTIRYDMTGHGKDRKAANQKVGK